MESEHHEEEEEKVGGARGGEQSKHKKQALDKAAIHTMYHLAAKWGFEVAVWNQETREAKTRQQQSKLAFKSPADRGLRPGRGGLGYGETTGGSMETMLRIFKELSSGTLELASSTVVLKRQYLTAVKAMSFGEHSHFLDIGSGLGKSILHIVMATGCRGTGMEVVENRFQ